MNSIKRVYIPRWLNCNNVCIFIEYLECYRAMKFPIRISMKI
ncbi:unnamed protein product [Schistosoma mattheei]|uniref:Uncharacterized protein n=1 Tax=Schistosoma mattheei TaxID=31246 RepID=A0A3P8IA49_9TREM|nr:unnamed protein product [Schistosoma mattheei]